MGNSDFVSISLRLDRALWSKLRSVAEREPDQSGRASVRGVIVRTLQNKFAECAGSKG